MSQNPKFAEFLSRALSFAQDCPINFSLSSSLRKHERPFLYSRLNLSLELLTLAFSIWMICLILYEQNLQRGIGQMVKTVKAEAYNPEARSPL
jgi:hypothetical protein